MGRFGTIHVGTCNVRTLIHDFMVRNLLKELNKISWDVVGLSEVRRNGEGSTTIEGHKLFYKGREKRGIGGIGFLVNKDWIERVVSFDGRSDRIGRLTIKLEDDRLVQFVQVYAPTCTVSLTEVKSFYADVKELQEDGDINVIMGDFNARLGSDSETFIGPYVHGKTNRRGKLLLEFIINNELYAMNTFFDSKPCDQWTWKSPNGTQSQIDYFLANAATKTFFKDCKVVTNINIDSDHRMVWSKICLKRQKRSHNSSD